MDAHLCPERGRHIGCKVHSLPSMIGEAENGGHHVPAGGCFQRWGDLLLITDTTRRRGGSSAEACSQHTGVSLSSLSAAAAEGSMALWRQEAVPITLTDYTGHKQQSGRIPAPAAICAGQGGGLALRGEDAGLLGIPGSEAVLRDEGLLFHPRLGAQCAGHIMEIPHLVPLVSGEGDGSRGRSRQWNQSRLCHQRRFQLGRQFLPTFLRPAQDTQAGRFA